jgi:hypothetical protein
MQHPLERPAESAGELYYPTPVTPEEAFQAIGRLRKEARDEIDRLIRFLDDTDNHMEREPDGDELDFSYPHTGPRTLVTTSGPELTNRAHSEDDEDDDADEDSDPAEPALGSLDGQADQTRWAAGGRRDLELDGAETGIGDLDGLLEQVGCGGWQGDRTGMV